MAILVTGGAGYIGSHCVRMLKQRGFDVIAADNLVKGHASACSDVPLYIGDVGDPDFLEDLFQKEDIDSVIHFAAYSLVGESVEAPGKYFSNNVGAGLNLLETMRRHNVMYLVFSSTAAVYGDQERSPIEEDFPKSPTNPYGESKLMVERIMHWYESAHGLRYAALRYFNVAGAFGNLGEDHRPETHLIPLVLAAAAGKQTLKIYGTDYPTPDGTCIRDYLHVYDLVNAHLLALDYLKGGGESGAFNLGSGAGFSVLEIIRAAESVVGHEIPKEEAPRRAGDPPRLVASSQKAQEVLGWTRQYDNIETIIKDAWDWHKCHPEGYGN